MRVWQGRGWQSLEQWIANCWAWQAPPPRRREDENFLAMGGPNLSNQASTCRHDQPKPTSLHPIPIFLQRLLCAADTLPVQFIPFPYSALVQHQRSSQHSPSPLLACVDPPYRSLSDPARIPLIAPPFTSSQPASQPAGRRLQSIL